MIAVLTRQLELHGAARSVELVRGLDPRGALDAGVAGLGPTGQGVFRQALAQAIHSSFLMDFALVAFGLVLVLLLVPSGSVLDLAQPEMPRRVERE